MNTTAPIRPSASENRTFGEMLAELIPLIDAVPGEGPPVIVLVGPWLLLVLMLCGPFAFLLILVVCMIVAATVLAFAVTLLAAPFLLVRRLRRHRARSALSGQAPRLVRVESPRVVA